MSATRKSNQINAKEIAFFESPSIFRKWLEQNHSAVQELWVGFYRKDSGRPSITWPESVDEALCFGWIDGLRKRIDAESYMIRFTPRRAISYWSMINIARVVELKRAGRMHLAGLRAFEQRAPERSGTYSYENRKRTKLDKRAEKQFRSSPAAWKFFQEQTPSYRQFTTWWVMSAKKEETRARRLAKLIEYSARGKRL